jgi:hypothetical protein
MHDDIATPVRPVATTPPPESAQDDATRQTDDRAHGARHEAGERPHDAFGTVAGRQFVRCFGTLGPPRGSLRPQVQRALADGRAIDPNDTDTWSTPDAHADASCAATASRASTPHDSSCTPCTP